MAREIATYPDTPTLLRQALHKSWRRDRFTRAWKLSWRWGSWAFTRYGTSFVAAALVSASTPDLLRGPSATPNPIDLLRLKPSYELTPFNQHR